MGAGASDRAAPAASRAVATQRFRVAVFSYGLPCPGQKRGGVDQAAHDLANALSDRGHDVVVFSFDDAPIDARYRTRTLPFKSFATSWLGKRVTMGYLGNALAICADYRTFDVVMAHGDSLLLPLTGKPIVRVMHGSAREEARSATSVGRRVLQYGVYLQELLTARLQPGTVGVSENTRAANRFVTRVIPDGIDLSLFTPDESRRSTRPSLLCVGALGGRKRGAWLLDLFTRRIQPRWPDAELHMVTADGPTTPGVTYYTGIDRAALVALYQRAWVYASPSTYEGFGLPYVEAMACATPVIATANPGSREVLANGNFGCLVTDDAFADAVCDLLERRQTRDALARAGLRRAADYDIRTAAEQYEALFIELSAHG